MPDHGGSRPDWAIVVHGGAKDIAASEASRYREGCERAVAAGIEVLSSGGSAVDAVVAAIRVLEDDDTFNAGTGAVHTRDGYAELDAAIMDGRTLDVGAVAALRGARNPILAAKAMLPVEETLLVADGARRFAEAHAPDAIQQSDARPVRSTGGDTVGCVAIDQRGDIASGTSTGGLEGSPPGRVGDSPIPGCGLYAENGVGGVSLSGSGERISRVTLAAWAMNALQTEDGSSAARSSMTRLEAVAGEGGIILLDAHGLPAWAHNSRDFAVAYATSNAPLTSFTRSSQSPESDPK